MDRVSRVMKLVWRPIFLVLLVAIVARVAAFWFLVSPNGDGYSYALQAEYSAEHLGLPPGDSLALGELHNTSPIFAFLLGISIAPFRALGLGDSSFAIVHAIFGALTALAVFLASKRYFGVKVAAFSGLFFALLPMEIYNEASIYAEPLAGLIVAFSFLAFVLGAGQGSPPRDRGFSAALMLVSLFLALVGVAMKLSVAVVPLAYSAYLLLFGSSHEVKQRLTWGLAALLVAAIGGFTYWQSQPSTLNTVQTGLRDTSMTGLVTSSLDRALNLFKSYTQVFFRPVDLGQMLSESSTPVFIGWLMASLVFTLPFVLGVFAGCRKRELRLPLIVLLLASLLVIGWVWVLEYGFFYIRVALPVLPVCAVFFGFGIRYIVSRLEETRLTRVLPTVVVERRYVLVALTVIAAGAILLAALAADAERTRRINSPTWEALEQASGMVGDSDVVLVPDPYVGWRTWHMRCKMDLIGGRTVSPDTVNITEPGELARELRRQGITKVWIDNWPSTKPGYRAAWRAGHLPQRLEEVIESDPDRFPVLKAFPEAEARLLDVEPPAT
jgi:4-amino-4-deoxy-L-arabinose transferase-like glycosyltransferase